MPLDASRLATSMKGKIEAIYGTPFSDSELQNFCNAISQAVVEEFVSNCQVNPGQKVQVNPADGYKGTSTDPGTIS